MAPARVMTPTRVEAIKEQAVLPGNPLQGIRILVVEDDPDSAKLITTLMSGCGAEVKAVGSCSAALDALHAQRPDVLLSDIEMPGENGFDLITKVRALSNENGGSIPAIALTAYAGDEHANRAVGAGYQVHVSKPVQLHELVRIVTRLTGGTTAAIHPAVVGKSGPAVS
jgi:CheY-like chemotaxis protein